MQEEEVGNGKEWNHSMNICIKLILLMNGLMQIAVFIHSSKFLKDKLSQIQIHA